MRTFAPVCAFLLLAWGAAAQQPGESESAAHLGKAIRLMQERRFNEAAPEFERAVALNPTDDRTRIQYATCLFAAERDEEARKQFEIERQRLGDLPGLSYYLGRLDLRANDFASAIRKLAPLENDRALPDVTFYLGTAYMSAGQPSAALQHLERAGKEDPLNPVVHYRLGRAYSMLGRTEDAEREYQQYRDRLDTQRIAERDGRECTDALRTRPIAQAQAICQRLADPNDRRRLIWLGELYCENGAFSLAIEPLEQAAKLAPDSFEAWHYLGLSLFSLKRYQEAVAPLRKAAQLNPRFSGTLTVLASTLHALGDDRGALAVLEQAHNLDAGDARVNALLEQLRTASGKQ